MKKITLFIFSLVFIQFSFGQCDYTLEMVDAYGDGWASTMDVLVDGVVVLDDVSATGTGTTLTFPVSVGSDVTTVFTAVGSWTGEASYRILDAEGTLVAERLGGGTGFGDPPPGDITTGTITGECPSCSSPSDVTLSNITTTGVDISWTAPGGSETAFEFEVVPYGDPEPTSGASVSAAVTSVQETGLMAGTAYDVYVRSVCGGDYSAWSTAVSFYTACEVATGAFTNDFDTHNAGLVSDAACWAVENGGSANGWSTGDDGLGNTFWFINWDSAVAHDDALYSPAFSVVDGLTDGISFDSWNESASWTEIIDVEVWDDTLNNFLGYLAEDLAPPTDQTSYVYDLSAYEGQSVRIAFYIATLDQYRIYIDNFVVDSYAALGVEEASMAQFTYFPNPVNDVLTIKAQKAVEDITVFNMLGQVVKQQTPNTMDCTVDLSAMQSGAYFVQVSIDNTVETVRVLKK